MTPIPHRVQGRRSFLRRAAGTVGAAAAVAAGTGLLAPAPALAVTPALTYADIPGTGDIKVLNYALALEALEADLYVQALARLTAGGRNALGRRIPGLGLNPNAPDAFYLRQFGKVEREHRDFLIGALGGQSLLLKAPFNRARFDFGMEKKSRREVMDLVYTAEQLGVTAYLGAIPLFATRTYLQTAGAIQGTEARHTAVIADVINDVFGARLNVAPLANQNAGRDPVSAPNVVLSAVSPFIVL